MAALKLTTTLIIVIAVSGLVGSLLILFLFFRCCRRPKSNPLPPIQPLAHHREKETNYLPRPQTFRNSLVPNPQGDCDSDGSLLWQSRKPSFQTTNSDGTPSSSNHSFPTPQTNLSPQSRPRSAGDAQTTTAQPYVSTTRQARSVSRGTRPRSRVVSTISTNTVFTQTSPRPTSMIRGRTHSSLHNFQIVLPAPLAPQLQNHMVAASLVETHPNSDPDPSTQAVSHGRRARSSSWHRSHRSLDTKDQSNPSESYAPSRGRNSSERSIQSLNKGDTTPPVPSLDGRHRPPQVMSQDLRDGQGTFQWSDRPLSFTKLH